MRDKSTVADPGELPRRAAGEHLNPLLLVVSPPRFGRKPAEPAAPTLMLLSQVLNGLQRRL